MASKSPSLKSRLSLLGIALSAVLALLAVSAITAQAETEPEPEGYWTVEGKALTGTEKLSETIQLEKLGSEEVPVVYLRGFLGKTTLKCTGVRAKEGTVYSNPGVKVHKGSINFGITGCVVQNQKGEEMSGCTVYSLSQQNGTISFNPAPIRFETLKGQTYAIIEEINSSLTVAATAGKTCAIAGGYSLSGQLGLPVATGASSQIIHTETSFAVQTASKSQLVVGSAGPYLESRFGLTLASGKKWGVGLH